MLVDMFCGTICIHGKILLYLLRFVGVFVMFVEEFCPWLSWIQKVLTNSSFVKHSLHFTDCKISSSLCHHICGHSVCDNICGDICDNICTDICYHICDDIYGIISDNIYGFTFASPQRGIVQGRSPWGRSCWCCLAWKYEYQCIYKYKYR